MAEAPINEMVRPCAELLAQAAETDDRLSEAQLQAQLGLGRADLLKVLEQLRENGKAVMVAPGEWSGPEAEPDSEPVPAGPVRVSVPEDESEEQRVGSAGLSELGLLDVSQPTVRLTRTIAEALDAEALGKLVLAGLTDLADGETFLMEIAP